MDFILMIFFVILTGVGLIYNNEIGVFVGLVLAPWQLIKLRKNKKLNLVVIIIASITGVIFLIIKQKWIMLILFLLIEIYNFWANKKIEID